MKNAANNTSNLSSSRDDRIYQKLVASPLYQTYKDAFKEATGLGLVLLPADAESEALPQQETIYHNPFCRDLNNRLDGCESCAMAGACLRVAAAESTETTTCFAGLRETMVPIKNGNQPIAFLSTGQVFTAEPRKSDFAKVENRLKNAGLDVEDINEFKKIWLEGKVMPVDQYRGAVTLLAAFGLQLSELLNRLIIEDAHSEPDLVTRAKQYVCAHLDEKVNLEDVAKRAGVSTFYFCKIFKATTGMTLTEYVNRRRVEWARRLLLNPQARVTEVAFDVGYQSLSQFNRSFLKYAGVSPSRYRLEQSSKKLSKPVLAA